MTGAAALKPAGGGCRLSSAVAAEAQGLVASGFGDLPAACAVLLSATTRGGAWLAALKSVAPVTAALGKSTPSVALAFTSLGLTQIGLPAETMAGFSLPFVEGMLQTDRRRRLGDVDEDGKAFAVAWGARPETRDDATSAAATTSEVKSRKDAPIHALLLVYHRSHAELMKLVDGAIMPALQALGVNEERRIALDLSADGGPDVREHFGFFDGISQPIPYGEGTDDGFGAKVVQDPLHGVPLGEILLGHADAHGTVSHGPFKPVMPKTDGTPSKAAIDAATVASLLNPAAQAPPDLGLNGSYLVVRELRQDVDKFWNSMEGAAKDLDIGLPAAPPDVSPSKPSARAAWLAERVIGRTRDGHMLRPDGPLPPAQDGTPDNDFLYYRRDRYGYGCPLGSHVRRANPRDGLAYEDSVCGDLLRSANAHRILRRGRKFGPDIGGPDSTSGKGLLFICLNGDIARQFEFVQQNWMLNPNFATLYNEVDPLVGPAGAMTLPAKPLRRRAHVETFVTLVGGDYFFLPSLSTIDILASL